MQAAQAARPLPDFRAGDILEVRMVVPEAGRKEYLYRGVCIARYNKGIRSGFKIFNVLPDSGGFVQHLPLYMPGESMLYQVFVHLKALLMMRFQGRLDVRTMAPAPVLLPDVPWGLKAAQGRSMYVCVSRALPHFSPCSVHIEQAKRGLDWCSCYIFCRSMHQFTLFWT